MLDHPLSALNKAKIVLIWYADLDQNDTEHSKKDSQNRGYARGITSADVSSLTGAVKTVSVLAEKVSQLERTQIWMKILIGLLGFVSALVIGFTVFFAQEGVRSFLARAFLINQ
jgi:hypothetical protein